MDRQTENRVAKLKMLKKACSDICAYVDDIPTTALQILNNFISVELSRRRGITFDTLINETLQHK